jgi:hypothetical protein
LIKLKLKYVNVQEVMKMNHSPNKENVTTVVAGTTPTAVANPHHHSSLIQGLPQQQQQQLLSLQAEAAARRQKLPMMTYEPGPVSTAGMMRTAGTVPNILKSASSSSSSKKRNKTTAPAAVSLPGASHRHSAPLVFAKSSAAATTVAWTSHNIGLQSVELTGSGGGVKRKSKDEPVIKIHAAAAVVRHPPATAGLYHDHSALVRPDGHAVKSSAPLTAIDGRSNGQHQHQPESSDQLLVEHSWDNYIGDIERTWTVFEKLDVTTAAICGGGGRTNAAEALTAAVKSEQFMSRLDRWGADGLVDLEDSKDYHRQLPFCGFLAAANRGGGVSRELEQLGIAPDVWSDPELFSELDRRHLAESVFLKKWLPKCAPMPRNDSYRMFLRELNKRDPAFNIVW